MVRYSRDDVLSERQLALLIKTTEQLPYPQALQTKFILYAAGYLGLRAGEIAHFDTNWIDWRDRVIRIPEHEHTLPLLTSQQHESYDINTVNDAYVQIYRDANDDREVV